MPEGFDLASLLTSVANTNLGLSDFANQAEKMGKEGMAIANQNAADAIKTADAAGRLAAMKAQEEKDKAAISTKIANTFGTNAQQSGWVGSNIADRILKSDQEAAAALDTIKLKNGIDFFDNPLGYLYSKATIDGDIADYDTAVKKRDLASSTLQKLESASQQSIQTNQALVSLITDQTISDASQIAARQYNAQAFQSQLEGLSQNMRGLQIAKDATVQQVQLRFSAQSAMMAEKQYALSAAHLSLARENAEENRKLKAQGKDDEVFTMKAAAAGYFAMTGNVMPDNVRLNFKTLAKLDPGTVGGWVKSGLDTFAKDPTMSNPIISNSPLDASNMIASGGVKFANESQKIAAEQLVNWRREFDSPAIQNKAGLDPKDKVGRERAFQAFVMQKARDDSASNNPNSAYAIPDLAVVAPQNKNISGTAVWQKVLGPMAAAGAKLNDPKFVVSSVTAAMNSGKITYDEALQLSSVYGSAVQFNNESKNFEKFGMPPSFRYTTQLPNPNGFFGKNQIEISDTKSWGMYLNKALATQTAARLAIARRSYDPLQKPAE